MYTGAAPDGTAGHVDMAVRADYYSGDVTGEWVAGTPATGGSGPRRGASGRDPPALRRCDKMGA